MSYYCSVGVESMWEDGKVLEIDGGDGGTTI